MYPTQFVRRWIYLEGRILQRFMNDLDEKKHSLPKIGGPVIRLKEKPINSAPFSEIQH